MAKNALQKETRPWGAFEILGEFSSGGGDVVVKKITVHAGRRLSLQSHAMRDEHWVIVAGRGVATIDGRDVPVAAGDAVSVPRGVRHRIGNVAGAGDLVFVETGTGMFDEHDIIRYEDDYGRAATAKIVPRGFTLVEILTVVVIIGVIAAIVSIAAAASIKKGRDAKRKAELSQIGRFLGASCYAPDDGPGDYELGAVLAEVRAKNAQAAEYLRTTPRDPRVGTASDSGYRYLYSSDGDCGVAANLENANERVTLPNLADPKAGGGTGVLRGSTSGVNGTNVYFEATN